MLAFSPADTTSTRPAAIIVGISLIGQEHQDLATDLDELQSLLETLQVDICARVVQKRQRLTAKCLLGTGKVEEVRALALQLNANLIVFDRALSGPQVRNLEKMTCCQVLDRHGVILEIFARHARSNQAKTQVEIARLQYLLPRLTGAWTHFQRQTGGGVRARGMGEKQIEIDRRRAKERIAKLRMQLGQIQREKAVQRKARKRELKVSFVGYTNGGKTTLMQALTNSNMQGKDALFATLDANVKTIDPETRPKILVSDTVGFIRNLPHSLIETFRSTLDEVLEADLLLHVVDISQQNHQKQITTTDEVLADIGAGAIPVLYVFNKVDRVTDQHLLRMVRWSYRDCIFVSAFDEKTIENMRKCIFRFFEAHCVQTYLRIPITDHETLSFVYETSRVLNADYGQESFVVMHVQTTKSSLFRLQNFVCLEDSHADSAS